MNQAVIEHPRHYVDGDLPTNTIEGVWSLLKRVLRVRDVLLRSRLAYGKEYCSPADDPCDDVDPGQCVFEILVPNQEPWQRNHP